MNDYQEGSRQHNQREAISRVDLHLHTTASDGTLTPSDLVRSALEAGLRTIAITDHDTTDGVGEAIRAGLGSLKVIAGVELSTEIDQVDFHVLGYFVAVDDPGLVTKLSELRSGRTDRSIGMVERLTSLGMPVDWERVKELAGGTVGRPHIARAMVQLGYVKTSGEAFDKYIGKGMPAYEERPGLTPTEAVKLIHQAGGVAVMAHPLSPAPPDLDSLLYQLATVGIDGLETYYGDYTPDQVAYLLKVAQKHRLIVTGGSDFHGPEVLPQYVLGATQVPSSVLGPLSDARLRRSGCSV